MTAILSAAARAVLAAVLVLAAAASVFWAALGPPAWTAAWLLVMFAVITGAVLGVSALGAAPPSVAGKESSVNDINPHDVYRETGRWFGPALMAAIAVFTIGAILTFAGWQLGWWFTAHNAARQNQVYQGSYAVQQADVDTMQNAVGAIASASGPATLCSAPKQA